MMKVSKDKNISKSNGLIERTSSKLDEVEEKTVHKDEEGDP